MVIHHLHNITWEFFLNTQAKNTLIDFNSIVLGKYQIICDFKAMDTSIGEPVRITHWLFFQIIFLWK
jgi:hypothetical protein